MADSKRQKTAPGAENDPKSQKTIFTFFPTVTKLMPCPDIEKLHHVFRKIFDFPGYLILEMVQDAKSFRNMAIAINMRGSFLDMKALATIQQHKIPLNLKGLDKVVEFGRRHEGNTTFCKYCEAAKLAIPLFTGFAFTDICAGQDLDDTLDNSPLDGESIGMPDFSSSVLSDLTDAVLTRTIPFPIKDSEDLQKKWELGYFQGNNVGHVQSWAYTNSVVEAISDMLEDDKSWEHIFQEILDASYSYEARAPRTGYWLVGNEC